MKKIYIMFFLLFGMNVFADCDACGCSTSGGSLGYSSLLNKNFIGVRYFYQQYTSKDGLYNNSPWVKENFNTAQLWSKFAVSSKFQVSAIIPFQFHNNEKTSGAQSISGLGDVSVVGFYSLLNKVSEDAVWAQNLELGAGVKAPTGKYNSMMNGTVNPSFQVGTGSWDFILLAEYSLIRESLGWNSSISYNIKTENKDQYQFGNQFNYNSVIFYNTKIDEVVLVPQVGVAGEVFQTNKQFGENLKDTKGDVLFGKLGVEIGFKKFGLGINGMLPISQNLTGGKVKSDYRLSVHLNYQL
nr:transporter [uncultured Flavobacterium sp.]